MINFKNNNIFNFVFSNDIGKEKQAIFLENFKSSKLFENFTLIENDKKFSNLNKQNEIYSNNTDIYKRSYNEKHKNIEKENFNLNSR